jgi:uncharacterized protein (TIGR00297 family)
MLQARGHLYATLLLVVVFAGVARLARGVSTSGTVAGATVAFILAIRDWKLFWMLVVVFLVTFVATRVGAKRKRRFQVAEAKSGRSASQVMSNLGVSALGIAISPLPVAYVFALAALAEVAADTTSSEIGAAIDSRTVLITTWKQVPPGTDGGISLAGTAAGIVAAVLVAACAALLGLTGRVEAVLIAGCGIAGMTADSVLGATLEIPGYLNNDLVNLLGTGFAGLLMLLLYGVGMR